MNEISRENLRYREGNIYNVSLDQVFWKNRTLLSTYNVCVEYSDGSFDEYEYFTLREAELSFKHFSF